MSHQKSKWRAGGRAPAGPDEIALIRGDESARVAVARQCPPRASLAPPFAARAGASVRAMVSGPVVRGVHDVPEPGILSPLLAGASHHPETSKMYIDRRHASGLLAGNLGDRTRAPLFTLLLAVDISRPLKSRIKRMGSTRLPKGAFSPCLSHAQYCTPVPPVGAESSPAASFRRMCLARHILIRPRPGTGTGSDRTPRAHPDVERGGLTPLARSGYTSRASWATSRLRKTTVFLARTGTGTLCICPLFSARRSFGSVVVAVDGGTCCVLLLKS